MLWSLNLFLDSFQFGPLTLKIDEADVEDDENEE
jgi:hypothetical protein